MSSSINAVLVRFSIAGVWNARKKDKQVTGEVASSHDIPEDAGHWSKNLFPESAVGDDNTYLRFRQAASRAKTWHYDHTLVWEEGLALVKGDVHEEYDNRVNIEFRKAVVSAADAFFDDYPNLIAKSRLKLNGTFNEEDYPPIHKLRDKFSYSVSYQPVPESGHYVDTIAAPKLAQLREELDRVNEHKIQAAVNEAWRRMLEPVQKLAEKLSQEDPTFHDTIITNIRDMVGLIPDLNITNDSRLAEAARLINDALGTVNPERLRASQFARVETAKKAVELISTFGLLGNRRLANAA